MRLLPFDYAIRNLARSPKRLALVIGCGGQRLLVQDADGGLGAHHGDLGVRPGEHLGGAQ